MASEGKLSLRSSDNEEFMVEKSVAMMSQTIKYMVEDGCASGVIPVPNVDSKSLAKVMEYCTKHTESKVSKKELKKFDEEFVEVDTKILCDLLLASNYLNINALLDLLVDKVASLIKGKTPEEIRQTFKIKNDFSPEEEAEVKRENAWAFD